MPTTVMPTEALDVHVIADSDTRWKWGAALAGRLAGDASDRLDRPPAPEVRIHGHLLEGRATPTDRQLADIGAPCTSLRRLARTAAVRDPALGAGSVVVLACVGGTVQALLHGLARAWAGRPERPVILTGYVGLVYERMVDGLLLRAGADVVVANSAHDAQRFRAVFTALGIDPAAIVTSALPFLGGPTHDPSAAGRVRPFTVCFVSQPSVPTRRDERSYLLQRVFAHAAMHPQRRVVVKLRGRPGEQTTHIERHHYVGLAPAPVVPANVEFAYGAMTEILDRTDLCVTVSSTAALEAMHRGIPTAVLTDLGIREALGNHVFLTSGGLTSWSELDAGALPVVEPGWAADNGIGGCAPYAGVRERIESLRAGGPLAPVATWYDPDVAGGYLPRLLARNGFDTDGTALTGPPGERGRGVGGSVAAVRRDITRRGARTVYRVGVRHVEPVVRRWAHL